MSVALESIEKYFKSNVYKPFYIAVGDEEYRNIKSKLVEIGDIEIIGLSKFCRSEDKKPDIDKLRETLRMIDIDCKSNNVVFLGLGEYLALEGESKATMILTELLSFNLGSAHAVFLLRGVSTQVKSLAMGDPRLRGRQIEICDDSMTSLSFSFASPVLEMYENNGFKKALSIAEDGEDERIFANSALDFPNSLISTQKIENPYVAICKTNRNFSIPKEVGSEEYWTQLLNELNDKRNLSLLFEAHGFAVTEIDFYEKICKTDYISWLYYIYLMSNVSEIKNPYLKLVVEKSNGLSEFKYNVLNYISFISASDTSFDELYSSRKRLVKSFPESEVSVFVSNNRVNPDESIYKLTDNTLVEQQEIIADIAKHGIPKNLESIFPNLAIYLKEYHFNGDTLNELLTEYFNAYKKQKVLNVINEDFMAKVEELANTRVYNRLRTRDELVASIDTSSTFLCWIDALGVEYLSFIVEMAQKKGLAVSVNVGRADLPTITSINKRFYEMWPEEHKKKIEDLDEVKHKEKGGYRYGPSNQYAIHLAKELKILEEAINEAATELGLRKYDKYVLASDHGASRLAVIRKQEEKYETDTQGEHSGRCCKSFEGCDLPYATEENGYIVLADYGRFKKSRAANVEVHGGATLEEVVVPIVSLSLRDSSIVIQLVDKTVKADFKTGTIIKLFVNKSISQPLYVDYKGKKYKANAVDENHYNVPIDEIKRAGIVEIDIYLGEDLISHLSVNVTGKSASMNSDFDDLF